MNTEEIKKIMESHIPNSKAIVLGEGAKFMVTVISDEFLDKSPLERQRRVYASVSSHIESGEIHALTIKARTVAEWQSDKINING